MILSAQAEHSLSYSSHCLKQAIPLMVKYKMPITPLNYAIWYAYVSNKTPELNDALDKIIDEFKTCSHEHAKALFNQFLSSDDLALFYQLSGGFNDVVGKVHQDINEAINYSTEFNQTLQECHLKLKNADISQETGFDDVLDLNDRMSFSYQHSMADSPFNFGTTRPFGETYTASWEVPFGYWTFGVSALKNEYRSEVEGTVSTIKTSGNSITIISSSTTSSS